MTPAEPFNLRQMDAELADTPFSGHLHHFPSIGSTNTYAVQQAAEGAPTGSVYFADEQTAGRGRGSHSWHSAAGSGLYVSVLLRPAITSSSALWISLAAGLAVHAAVEKVTGLRPDLRWPNDLLLGPKKFCGILTEVQNDGDRLRQAVVGIGINVGQAEFPPELSHLATSLRIEGGRVWSRQPLLVALLQSLHQEVSNLYGASGAASPALQIPERLEAISSWIRGRRVRVGEQEEFYGVTAGLDSNGFLLVDTSSGIRKVLSGGVRDAGAE